MRLEAAGNTVIPAILLIRQMGYSLTIDNKEGRYLAEKKGNSFAAENPLLVLGLIKLFEMKGKNWRASDEEIERVLKEMS